jgi:hypothetical protein
VVPYQNLATSLEASCKSGTVETMEQENEKVAKLSREEKLKRLIKQIEALQESRFTGYIKLNFTQGSIGRIEKFEEISHTLK